MPEPSRRHFLTAITGSVLALTGCQTTDPETETIETSRTRSPTPSPTEETETPTPSPDIPPVYQLDFRNPNGENMGEYNTRRNWDNQTIDLEAMMEHHLNNYEQSNPWVQEIVESIGNPEKYTEVKNNGTIAPYPDGSFDFEDFASADTLREAQDPLIRYIANFEDQVNDRSLLSTRDTDYAAIHQEANNRHTNVDSHVWAHKMGFGRHGIIAGYDEGKDELLVMETVRDSPVEGADRDYIVDPQPIEQAAHTDSDTYWHPVQFAREEYNGRDFEEAKKEATLMFVGAGGKDLEGEFAPINPSHEENNLAPTTGFAKDFTNAIGTYNKNNYDFNIDIKNNALVTNKQRLEEGQFIIDEVDYEDDNIVVEAYDISDYDQSDELLKDIWADEEGVYDNFRAIVDAFQSDNYDTIRQAATAS